MEPLLDRLEVLSRSDEREFSDRFSGLEKTVKSTVLDPFCSLALGVAKKRLLLPKLEVETAVLQLSGVVSRSAATPLAVVCLSPCP